MVLQTLKGLGADRCVYVGDSEVDVATARNAGVPCVSVLWGFRDEKILVDAGADVFCDDAACLPDIIESVIEKM